MLGSRQAGAPWPGSLLAARETEQAHCSRSSKGYRHVTLAVGESASCQLTGIQGTLCLGKNHDSVQCGVATPESLQSASWGRKL